MLPACRRRCTLGRCGGSELITSGNCLHSKLLYSVCEPNCNVRLSVYAPRGRDSLSSLLRPPQQRPRGTCFFRGNDFELRQPRHCGISYAMFLLVTGFLLVTSSSYHRPALRQQSLLSLVTLGHRDRIRPNRPNRLAEVHLRDGVTIGPDASLPYSRPFRDRL